MINHLWSESDPGTTKIRLTSAREATRTEIRYRDHHIQAGAKVFSPVSIERSVWEYFSGKAEQKGVALSELLTDVLKRDIEINEALK